tara:strand:- start:1075 stop:1587 length:513 start_codon:yes stop_codon:yes gene_type:complete
MIILSLGSNLNSRFGNKFQNLELAMSFLENYGILVEKKSAFYETPSYPDQNNPKFINIAIIVKTDLPLIDLMSVLIHIEEKLERKRDKKNDPRTCDIDIIDYNSQIVEFEYKGLKLIVPHKNLTSRNFVLYPLKEIIPNWHHPKTKEDINTLIEKLSIVEKNSILKVEKS